MLTQKEIGKQTMAAFRRLLGSQIWTDPTPPPQFRIFTAVPPRPVVQLMMRKDAEANIEVSERKADGHTPAHNLRNFLLAQSKFARLPALVERVWFEDVFIGTLLRRCEAIAKTVLDKTVWNVQPVMPRIGRWLCSSRILQALRPSLRAYHHKSLCFCSAAIFRLGVLYCLSYNALFVMHVHTHAYTHKHD